MDSSLFMGSNDTKFASKFFQPSTSLLHQNIQTVIFYVWYFLPTPRYDTNKLTDSDLTIGKNRTYHVQFEKKSNTVLVNL